LQDLQAEGLGLSVVALAEVYEGVYYARDPEESERGLNDFLESVTLIGIEEETAKIFGRERGKLRAAGMIIGDMDLLIGATALQHNLTVLTNNRRPKQDAKRESNKRRRRTGKRQLHHELLS
jgi:tRNA(fMet)-specific endonuclease VapC